MTAVVRLAGDQITFQEVPVDDGELVAAAPHFSIFGTFVVDPAKAGWSATKTGVQAASCQLVL